MTAPEPEYAYREDYTEEHWIRTLDYTARYHQKWGSRWIEIKGTRWHNIDETVWIRPTTLDPAGWLELLNAGHEFRIAYPLTEGDYVRFIDELPIFDDTDAWEIWHIDDNQIATLKSMFDGTETKAPLTDVVLIKGPSIRRWFKKQDENQEQFIHQNDLGPTEWALTLTGATHSRHTVETSRNGGDWEPVLEHHFNDFRDGIQQGHLYRIHRQRRPKPAAPPYRLFGGPLDGHTVETANYTYTAPATPNNVSFLLEDEPPIANSYTNTAGYRSGRVVLGDHVYTFLHWTGMPPEHAKQQIEEAWTLINWIAHV